jgi:hypothetical protein
MNYQKSPRAANPHLLSMARNQPCLIRSPVCNGNPETTVACHASGVKNGKGMGYKVGDHLTAWGCSSCNDYTDAFNGATKEQKQAAFDAAHKRQVAQWREIATDGQANRKDREAAQWALDQLEEK